MSATAIEKFIYFIIKIKFKKIMSSISWIQKMKN